jgi:hypothetical protein
VEACFSGHTATAELLIAKGADVNAKDKVQIFALNLKCYLIMHWNLSMIRVLSKRTFNDAAHTRLG